MNDSFVYSWSDHKTSKVYVGVHKGFENDGYICSSEPMLKEYKEKPQDFTRQIIAKGFLNDCAKLERQIIIQLLKEKETCYNRSAWPMVAIDEAISNKMKKAWVNRRKTSFSDETRLKMSLAGKGVLKTEEHKAKIKLALSGKPKSFEQIQKMREVNLGKTLSAETKRKISEAHKGRRMSEEQKEKLRQVWAKKKDSNA